MIFLFVSWFLSISAHLPFRICFSSRFLKYSFLHFVSIKDHFLYVLNLVYFLSGPQLHLTNQSLTFAQQRASSFYTAVMMVYRILKFHPHAFDRASVIRLPLTVSISSLFFFSPHADESFPTSRLRQPFFFFWLSPTITEMMTVKSTLTTPGPVYEPQGNPPSASRVLLKRSMSRECNLPPHFW